MAARLGLILLATAATTALVAAAPAGAQRISWSERYPYHGPVAMRFTVSNVSIGTGGWSAEITFRNLTKKTITLNGNSFGIAYYSSSTITPTTRPAAFVAASSFSHAAPAKLAPGASWTGVIRGRVDPTVKGKTWVRVVFGPFAGVPGGPKNFIWITDHKLPLTLGKKSGSGGLVI